MTHNVSKCTVYDLHLCGKFVHLRTSDFSSSGRLLARIINVQFFWDFQRLLLLWSELPLVVTEQE